MENFEVLILPLLGVAVAGYLLGSISSAIILTRIFVHDDVRSHGSGNVRTGRCSSHSSILQ